MRNITIIVFAVWPIRSRFRDESGCANYPADRETTRSPPALIRASRSRVTENTHQLDAQTKTQLTAILAVPVTYRIVSKL